MPVCQKICVKGTGGHGLSHTIDGLWAFLAIFAFFYLFVHRWRIFYGPALCASGCVTAVFVGREFSDRHKLGYWDWEGLLTPSITFTLAAVLISIAVRWSQHRKRLGGHNSRKDLPPGSDDAPLHPHRYTQIGPAVANAAVCTCNEQSPASTDSAVLVFMPSLAQA